MPSRDQANVEAGGKHLINVITLHQGLSNEQVLRYVVEGGVMERPEHCPDRLYELMRACWSHRPTSRPTFLQLVAELATVAAPYFRHRSFFHTPEGQELYSHQQHPLGNFDMGTENRGFELSL